MVVHQQAGPQVPPASSSARNASTTSRGGRRPSRRRSRTTASIIASMSFMSTAPRPQTQSPAISPENGCTCQSPASAGTTSRWPWMSRPGRSGSSPSIRATTLVRFGMRLEHRRLEPDLGQERGDVLGRGALPGPGVVARVGGVDPDQVAGRCRRPRPARSGLLVAGGFASSPSSSHARAVSAAPVAARRWSAAGPPARLRARGPSAAAVASAPSAFCARRRAARICYRDAASHGISRGRHASGWRNRQTR